MAFRGTFDYSLDQKKRLTVPAKFRAALSEGVVLSTGTAGCVEIWKPEDFDGRLEACRELYLPEGVVSVEQVRQTLTLIRSHVPLPVTARVPSPDELLYVASRRAVRPPAAAR